MAVSCAYTVTLLLLDPYVRQTVSQSQDFQFLARCVKRGAVVSAHSFSLIAFGSFRPRRYRTWLALLTPGFLLSCLQDDRIHLYSQACIFLVRSAALLVACSIYGVWLLRCCVVRRAFSLQ
jgi:hypothetical protein